MKKLYFVFALLFAALATKAQYFQHEYGMTDNDYLNSGVNTLVQPQGHFMGGTGYNPATGFTPGITATYADATGNIPGAPFFNKFYTITNPGGVVLFVRDIQVFEQANGSGFGIIGLYNDPSLPWPNNAGVFYLKLDPIGNIMGVYNYQPLPSAGFMWEVITVGGTNLSTSGNEVYVTGSAQVNGPFIHIYALKIDVNNGMLAWSQVYDLVNSGTSSKDWGNDIIESPYTPVGNPEVVIVGNTYNNSGSTADGFVFRLDANTGLPSVPWPFLFGSGNSDEWFNSIEIANSTTGGSNGFVLGGISNYNGSFDYWLVKTGPTCMNTIWGTLHDYSVNPGSFDECFDVIERLNTSSQYEYYMGGTTNNGVHGSTDMLVIKTDDWGNGVANGEFTYGGPNADFGRQLAQFNGTPFDGLSVFGTIDMGAARQNDMYLVKAYFDGNSGCMEHFSNPNPQAGPGLYAELYAQQYTTFVQTTLFANDDPTSDFEFCNTASIPGASNARIAPAEPKGDKQAVISPNPMQQGAPAAIVELDAETASQVSVTIYDMLGKQYYTGSFTLAKGKNQLPVDISNANMAAGMYTVKIHGEAINKNILLMVK